MDIVSRVVVVGDARVVLEAILEERAPWTLKVEIGVGNNGCLTEEEIAMTLAMAAHRIYHGELQDSHSLRLSDVEGNTVGRLTLAPT